MGGGIVEFWPPSPSRPSVTFGPIGPRIGPDHVLVRQKRDSDAVLTVPETPAPGNRQLLDARKMNLEPFAVSTDFYCLLPCPIADRCMQKTHGICRLAVGRVPIGRR